eukprot:TRINITY_DN757_c0_g4_i1.p1 TRINITY_DN757_c0_g4~~TRINITY_DN757_c0_g4_i1.p1  ORF type:complete len:566 (+),score=145.55 TRINITY_DN757_c0_g4_i1:126-1823(+)
MGGGPAIFPVGSLLLEATLRSPQNRAGKRRRRVHVSDDQPKPAPKLQASLAARRRRETIAFTLASSPKQDVDRATDAVRTSVLQHCGGQMRRMLWSFRRLRRAALIITRALRRLVNARRAFVTRGVECWKRIEHDAREARALRPLPSDETRAACVHLAELQGAGREALMLRKEGWRQVRSWGGVRICNDDTKLRVMNLLWVRKSVVEAASPADDELPGSPCSPSSPVLWGRRATMTPFVPGAVARALRTPGVPEFVRSAVAAARLAEGTSRAEEHTFGQTEGIAERALREAIYGDSAPRYSPEERLLLREICWPPEEEEPEPARVRVLPQPLSRHEVEELALIDWGERERRERQRQDDAAASADTLSHAAEFRRCAEEHLDAQRLPDHVPPRRRGPDARPSSALPSLAVPARRTGGTTSPRPQKRSIRSAGAGRRAPRRRLPPVLTTGSPPPLPPAIRRANPAPVAWAFEEKEVPREAREAPQPDTRRGSGVADRKSAPPCCSARELRGLLAARVPKPAAGAAETVHPLQELVASTAESWPLRHNGALRKNLPPTRRHHGRAALG